MRTAKIENHYTIDDLEKIMKKYRDNIKIYERLLFIRMLMKEKTITEAADLLNIRRETGSRWLKEYNKNKLDGLIPNYSKVGSKSKLTDEQFKELEAEITREDKHYNIKAVQKYIKDKYGVEYTYKQVWVITREKMGLNYAKPFLKYQNRPKNYKELLKKT